jgi:hypothetical protein
VLVAKIVPEHKSVRVANHTGVFQFGGDAASGVAGMQKHERLPRRGHRLGQCPGQPSAGGEDGKQHKDEKGAHSSNSLDEGGPLVVSRWSLGVGHWALGVGHWSVVGSP